eukprot:7788954-Pyramimonas_sp.AAC.2
MAESAARLYAGVPAVVGVAGCPARPRSCLPDAHGCGAGEPIASKGWPAAPREWPESQLPHG